MPGQAAVVDRTAGHPGGGVATLTGRSYRQRMGGVSELPTWAKDALAGVYDPCCREKGLSVLDMGLVRSVEVSDGVARVELLLTSGWCPFAATVLTQVRDRVLGQPGIRDADVSVVWDEAW